MLRALHISHYVLIDSLDAEFPDGLVIITGQTGAGKSILLGALSLLTGARADASVISQGADSCVVEAEFVSSDPGLKEKILAQDIEWDDGELLLRRVIHASGRSRSFVNDSPVSLPFLSELSGSLVDIHSQNRNLVLTSHAFQLSLLDEYAGNMVQRREISALWKRLQGKRSELESTRETLSKLSSQRDYNNAQLEELTAAKLREGEQEELEQTQKSLADGESIMQNLRDALGYLVSGEEDEDRDVSASLKQAERILERSIRQMPALEPLVSRLGSVRVELEDIVSSLEQIERDFDYSPEKLSQVEDRLSLLYELERKHNVNGVAGLIETREAFAKSVFDSSALEEKAVFLEKEVSSLSLEYDSLASSLHEKRTSAAPSLANEILSSLRFLELDKASFAVELRPASSGAYGCDEAVYTFSSGNGLAMQELSKCASGGEISRIMLSLKAMMARYEGMPTLIFDEIDTGVSGSAANRMGRMICDMGQNMQVFAITHLPQVAAKGSAHYVVEKAYANDGLLTSSIRKVEGEERVREIARLLSGDSITPEAIANARSLILNS